MLPIARVTYLNIGMKKMPSRSEGWLPAKVRDGPSVPCPAGDGLVKSGEWMKGKRLGRLYQVFHDDCAEDAGAYEKGEIDGSDE